MWGYVWGYLTYDALCLFSKINKIDNQLDRRRPLLFTPSPFAALLFLVQASSASCGGVMGFRFFKRLNILPGVQLNLSKGGGSVSVGPQGAKMTLGTSGGRVTFGLPGTGLFYSLSH